MRRSLKVTTRFWFVGRGASLTKTAHLANKEKTGLKSSNLTAEQMSSKVKGGNEEDAFAIPTTKALLPFQRAQLMKAQAAEEEEQMQQEREQAVEREEKEEKEDEPLMMLNNSDEDEDYGNIEEDAALNTSLTDINLDNLTNEEDDDDDDDDGEDSIEEAPLNTKSGGGMKLKFTMPHKQE